MDTHTISRFGHGPTEPRLFSLDLEVAQSKSHHWLRFHSDGTGTLRLADPKEGIVYQDKNSFKWDPSTFPIATLLKDMADGKRNTIEIQNTEDGYYVKYLHNGADDTGCDLNDITRQIMYHHIKNADHLIYRDLTGAFKSVITPNTHELIEDLTNKLYKSVSYISVGKATSLTKNKADFAICLVGQDSNWTDRLYEMNRELDDDTPKPIERYISLR